MGSQKKMMAEWGYEMSITKVFGAIVRGDTETANAAFKSIVEGMVDGTTQTIEDYTNDLLSAGILSAEDADFWLSEVNDIAFSSETVEGEQQVLEFLNDELVSLSTSDMVTKVLFHDDGQIYVTVVSGLGV